MQDRDLETRVARLEERGMLQEEIRQERAMETIRRLTSVETGVTELKVVVSDLKAAVSDLAVEARSHVFKSTCTKVGTQTLLGGGAGAVIVTALVALVWTLKQLGLI